MKTVSAILDWVAIGFTTVIPEVFIFGAAVFVVAAWVVLARLYQRCPHCHRFVRRAYARHLQCPRCGRQYYYGLRAMR